jgi:hypothetical protein
MKGKETAQPSKKHLRICPVKFAGNRLDNFTIMIANLILFDFTANIMNIEEIISMHHTLPYACHQVGKTITNHILSRFIHVGTECCVVHYRPEFAEPCRRRWTKNFLARKCAQKQLPFPPGSFRFMEITEQIPIAQQVRIH